MPFENRLQAIINSLESGAGMLLMRGVVFLCLAGAVFVLYAGSQFRGLKDAEAMECAQLARNLAQGRGYTTQCLRPADLGYPQRQGRARPALDRWPELRMPPAYPALLAAAFRLARTSFAPPRESSVFGPEAKVIVPLGIVLVLATGAIVFLLGRLLFDSRTGLLAMVVFLVTDMVLADSISGTPRPLEMLLSTSALYAAAVGERKRSDGWPWQVWRAPFGLAALLCALAFLTRYALVALVPLIAVFVAVRSNGWRWMSGVAFALVVALAVAPWLARNVRLCGQPFGFAPQTALNRAVAPESPSLDRSLDPELSGPRANRVLRAKLREALVRLPDSLPAAGVIMAFFAASLFWRTEKDEVNALRVCLLSAWVLMAAAGGLWDSGPAAGCRALLPTMMVFGAAFFFFTIEKAEFMDALWQTVLPAAFVLVMALPAAARILGPRAAIPYPPYFPPFAGYVSGLLEPGELLCTDIPWATAWYGDRTSLLLPSSVDEMMKIQRSGRNISGVYLTTETSRIAGARGASDAAAQSWLPMFDGKVPAEVPFTHALRLPPGSRDQIFLTDRQRWKPMQPGRMVESGQDGVKIEARGQE